MQEYLKTYAIQRQFNNRFAVNFLKLLYVL